MVEILERLILENVEYGRLPSFWDDKPNALGFHKANKEILQQYVDLVHSWINGISISNAVGKNLDDIGYAYGVPRYGMPDEEYRGAILLKMASYSDSGTTTDVIRFVRSAFLAAFADITQYPDTRFGTMRVEGAVITTDKAANINKKVTSGSRVDVTWDLSGNSFIPACLIPSAPPQDLLASLDSGTDELGAVLGAGILDTIGYIVEDVKTVYPAGKDRSTLSLGKQGMTVLLDSDGNPIELITDAGLVPLEILLDSSLGGRYLASLPMTKQ